MIDFSKLTGCECDSGNSRTSHEKHNVTQGEAEQAFFNEPLLVLHDQKHSSAELRLHAYGKTDKGRKLHIAFTLRENVTLIRVISARDMHRKERATYEKA
jgi:hypothetical protein